MKRIAIDMDEVMADSVARELEWYNKMFETPISRADLWESGKHLYYTAPEIHQQQIWDNIRIDGFFKDLPIVENAVEVIKELHEKYEIFIVTAAMPFPNSFIHKYEWLEKYFPFISHKYYVYCGHKYMIQADYLIDDNSYNFDGFPGQGLLFSAPHNIKEEEGNFQRVNNWLEVQELLL